MTPPHPIARVYGESDERALVLAALAGFGEGARTFYLAAKLGWSTSKTRYYLLDLERAGKVERHPRYTAVNDIFWRLTTPPSSCVRDRA